jgi:hypothetical protein
MSPTIISFITFTITLISLLIWSIKEEKACQKHLEETIIKTFFEL